jgi:hypothetical protein
LAAEGESQVPAGFVPIIVDVSARDLLLASLDLKQDLLGGLQTAQEVAINESGVETDLVRQMKQDVPLGRVAEDDRIGEGVGIPNEQVTDPKEFLLGLEVQSLLRMDAGVDAEKRLCDVAGLQLVEETQVVRRDPWEDPRRGLQRGDPVAGERGATSIDEKGVAVVAGKTNIREKHILVIALEEYSFDLVAALPGQQEIDHAHGVRPAVDIVPEKNHAVRRVQGKGLEKAREFIRAAVDVSDDVRFHRRFIVSYGRS